MNHLADAIAGPAVAAFVIRSPWLMNLLATSCILCLFFALVESRHRRTTLFSCVASALLLWLIVSIEKTEWGTWAALSEKSETGDFVDFLAAFPKAAMADSAQQVVRRRVADLVANEGHPLRRALFVEFQRQARVPAQATFCLRSTRPFLSKPDLARIDHYVVALDSFDLRLADVITAMLAEGGARTTVADACDPPFEAPTVVVSYIARWGAEFREHLSQYDFTAIELTVDWSVYLPSQTEPLHSSRANRIAAPWKPSWQGRKKPERVVVDVVIDSTMAVISRDLGAVGSNHRSHPH